MTTRRADMLLMNAKNAANAPSRMATTHFERILRDKMAEAQQALMAAPMGDVHRHCFIKGQHEGLESALKAYREALKIDQDEDP